MIFFVYLVSIVNAYSQKSEALSKADSMLLAASVHGVVKVIKQAVVVGANVNAMNEMGKSPLNLVSKLSYEFLVRYLVAAGANVNTSNNNKITLTLMR